MRQWLNRAALLGTGLLMVACTHTQKNDSDLSTRLTTQSWQIEYIAGDGVIDYSPAQLTFAADGQFSGDGSCNRIFGRYTLDGDKLQIADDIGSTRMSCPPALMNQEARLVSVLPGVHRIRWENGILFMTDSSGAPTLQAAAVSP